LKKKKGFFALGEKPNVPLFISLFVLDTPGNRSLAFSTWKKGGEGAKSEEIQHHFGSKRSFKPFFNGCQIVTTRFGNQ
jgi:hypothetical protein